MRKDLPKHLGIRNMFSSSPFVEDMKRTEVSDVIKHRGNPFKINEVEDLDVDFDVLAPIPMVPGLAMEAIVKVFLKERLRMVRIGAIDSEQAKFDIQAATHALHEFTRLKKKEQA